MNWTLMLDFLPEQMSTRMERITRNFGNAGDLSAGTVARQSGQDNRSFQYDA
jgi:hypothetical protein